MEILNGYTAQCTNSRVEGLINWMIQRMQAKGVVYWFEALRAEVIHGTEKRRDAREQPTVLYQRLSPK
jgi:hypothetical protein